MASIRVGVFLSLIFLLSAFLFSVAYAAPLEYEIIDPSKNGQTHKTDKDIAILHKAHIDANHQIDRMHHVVNNHKNPYNNLVLTKAFGKNYNIHEIKTNVDLLKSSKVKVETVRGDLNGANAKTSRPDGHLHFDHKYYTGKTDRERAGTLIHEAAHSLFNTHDHFTNEVDPRKTRAVSSGEKRRLEEAQAMAHKAAKKEAKRQGKPIPRSKDLPKITLSGYVKTPDFNPLKSTASHVMHHNSDSYKVLGHLSTYGLLAPLDKDRGRRHPLVDNKGIPSKIVKHGGSMIPVSTKRLANTEEPVINPYTSKPLKLSTSRKTTGTQSGPGPKVHSKGSHLPSKIPVSSQLLKIRKAKEKALRLSPDSRVKLYSNVAKSAHDNHHILQTAVHAQNSRRKDVVREKPLPPLPHDYHPSRPTSRSHSRLAAHPAHAPREHSHKRPETPRHRSSTPRPKSPAKRPSSPKRNAPK